MSIRDFFSRLLSCHHKWKVEGVERTPFNSPVNNQLVKIKLTFILQCEKCGDIKFVTHDITRYDDTDDKDLAGILIKCKNKEM